MGNLDSRMMEIVSDPLRGLSWMLGIMLVGFLAGLLIAHWRSGFRLERTPFIVGFLMLSLAVSVVMALALLWPDLLQTGGFASILMVQAGAFGGLSLISGLFSGARGRDAFGNVLAGFLILIPFVFLWLMFRAPRQPVEPAQSPFRKRISGERGVLLIIVLLTLNFIANLWLDKRLGSLELFAVAQSEAPVSKASTLTDAEKAVLAEDLKEWADGFVIPFALNDEFTLIKVHSTHVMGFLHLQARQPFVEREDDQAFFAPIPCEDEQLVALFERGAQALVLIINPDGSNTGVFGYSAAYCGQ